VGESWRGMRTGPSPASSQSTIRQRSCGNWDSCPRNQVNAKSHRWGGGLIVGGTVQVAYSMVSSGSGTTSKVGSRFAEIGSIGWVALAGRRSYTAEDVGNTRTLCGSISSGLISAATKRGAQHSSWAGRESSSSATSAHENAESGCTRKTLPPCGGCRGRPFEGAKRHHVGRHRSKDLGAWGLNCSTNDSMAHGSAQVLFFR
jgi:hypothetical protein